MNNEKSIVLYMHVHQPFRVKHYTIFDAGQDTNYFATDYHDRTSNERIMHKVAEKSYIPTNQRLLKLLNDHPEFRFSLSITGTAIEQMQRWAPDALTSFQELTKTGRVEIVGETYHHTLAFFYDKNEFELQVLRHKHLVENFFGQTPTAFRNTELAYNNDLAWWADKAGYKVILAEGWDPILGWRSPNFVYQPTYTEGKLKLLLKNYKLSDDIAFRFGDQNWEGWPLTADKFSHWLSESGDATNFNLFMDYETFGEHQWDESGIFGFLEHLPIEWLKKDNHTFKTVTQAASENDVKDRVDMPHIVTWADTERDLSAWVGNSMQHEALQAIYSIKDSVLSSHDHTLIEDWRRLQTSDHFYYMCTKYFNDGDIHAYFSPYENPYDAFIAYMNAWHDIRLRAGAY
jgi:alpha-amylase